MSVSTAFVAFAQLPQNMVVQCLGPSEELIVCLCETVFRTLLCNKIARAPGGVKISAH